MTAKPASCVKLAVMQGNGVYLDYAATSPLDERVLQAMLPYLREPAGNPSSLHSFGASASEAIEEARGKVAAMIGASPEEVIFTSGGTESDNLGVLGLARSDPGKRHVVVSPVEHAAVRECVASLEHEGYEISRLAVDGHGRVDPGDVERALRPDTALVAVMWANNEVGTVEPVEEIARVCAERGVPLHVDAVQAAGRLPMDTGRVPLSTLALSSHKLYGPQGVGALYVREGVRLEPVVHGGGQERGLRSGTENVAGIVGFGEAARLAGLEREQRVRHDRELRDLLIAGVSEIPGVHLRGHPEERLPNNVHLTVEGVESESLVLMLDALGYAIGRGSACASSGHKASPVLLAMGITEEEAFSAVRVTVGKDTSREDVSGFVGAFREAVERLRELSPVRVR